jgi:hypothetical protein
MNPGATFSKRRRGRGELCATASSSPQAAAQDCADADGPRRRSGRILQSGGSGDRQRLHRTTHARARRESRERAMPGVLNYIDLALAGAYADLQEFYRHGLTQLDATRARPQRRLHRASPRHSRTKSLPALEAAKADGFAWPTAREILQHSAHAHHGRHVRRSRLWREQDFAGWRLVGSPARSRNSRKPKCRARPRTKAAPSSACKRRGRS